MTNLEQLRAARHAHMFVGAIYGSAVTMVLIALGVLVGG